MKRRSSSARGRRSFLVGSALVTGTAVVSRRVHAGAPGLPTTDCPVVPTVAELRELAPADELAAVRTLGYWAPGDGGAGIYLARARAELRAIRDYDPYLMAGGGVSRRESLYEPCTDPALMFVLQHQGHVCARQFGAMGDEDDADTGLVERLQRAIWFAAREGAALTIGPGRYPCHGRLRLTDGSQINAAGAHLRLMTGTGPAGAFINIVGSDATAMEPSHGRSDAAPGIRDVRWSGGIVDLQGQPGENGFGCQAAHAVVIENAQVRDARVGGVDYRTGGRGITFHPGCRSAMAVNCHVFRCDIGLDTSSKTRNPNAAASGWRTRGLSFRDCLVEECAVAGLHVEMTNNPAHSNLSMQHVVVDGCHFFNCSGGQQRAGVLNGGHAVGVAVRGCTVRNDRHHPIAAVIMGSFRVSSFELSLDVDVAGTLISAAPHHIEAPRIHDRSDNSSLDGLNIGNRYHLHAVFDAVTSGALVRGYPEGEGAGYSEFIRGCRFHLDVYQRAGRYRGQFVADSTDYRNVSTVVDVHAGTEYRFRHGQSAGMGADERRPVDASQKPEMSGDRVILLEGISPRGDL